ncbi:tRNA/rRNA methyltransferase [candidate division KSB1 bacterium]|nr:tRNA/rRNA methyltransferase [candidate division KSB1 bacterium]
MDPEVNDFNAINIRHPMTIHFILVEPARPENIGASARALRTMGFDSLRLVNPVDHLGDRARQLAFGSEEILENAEIYNSLDEAIKDVDLSITSTAKPRVGRKQVISSRDLCQRLAVKKISIQTVAMVFGRENQGLSTKEVHRCDWVSTVPLAAPYPSLNLAQSVMLYAYELSNLDLTNEHAHRESNPEAFRLLMQRAPIILSKLGLEPDAAMTVRISERLSLLEDIDIGLFHLFLNRL